MGMESIKVFKVLDPHTVYTYDPKPDTESSRVSSILPFLRIFTMFKSRPIYKLISEKLMVEKCHY